MPVTDPTGGICSIARTITAVGDRWSLQLVREAAMGTTRFTRFRERLGIASDVLTERLQSLVDLGVLERVAYQEEGARARTEYRMTDAGREFHVVLGALGDWGREHLASDVDAGVRYRDGDGRPVHVAFVDESGSVLRPIDVEVFRD